MLHLSKNSYCLATALLMSLTPGPTCTEPSPSQVKLGRMGRIRESPASLAAVLNVPVRVVGGLQNNLVLLLEDNGATENLVMHALAEKLKLAKAPTTMLIGAIEGDFK